MDFAGRDEGEMAATKVFQVSAELGSVFDRALVRVNAVSRADAEEQAKALLVGFTRAREIFEVPTGRASGSPGKVTMDVGEGTVIWTGHSDTTAGPGHRGCAADVLVTHDGAIQVSLLAPSVAGSFAPLDWREEALALRGAVRGMADRLLEPEEDAPEPASILADPDPGDLLAVLAAQPTDTAFLRFWAVLRAIAWTVQFAAENGEACPHCGIPPKNWAAWKSHEEACPGAGAISVLAEFGLLLPDVTKPSDPRGSHLYANTREREECMHGCGCWVDARTGGAGEPSPWGGPEGVNPYGACPKAPPIRYPLRSERSETGGQS